MCTIKTYLQKQKGGICPNINMGQKATLSLTLFTLNFLKLDSNGQSAADRHVIHASPKELVKWKDVLDNQ